MNALLLFDANKFLLLPGALLREGVLLLLPSLLSGKPGEDRRFQQLLERGQLALPLNQQSELFLEIAARAELVSNLLRFHPTSPQIGDKHSGQQILVHRIGELARVFLLDVLVNQLHE